MFASSTSNETEFTGDIVVSSLSGEILSAFEVEANEYLGYYPVKELEEDLNMQDVGSFCDDCDDDWAWIDHLPEVVIEEPPSSGGGSHFFLAWLFDVPEVEDEGEGASPVQDSPELGGGSGQDANQDPCPPGQIKDDNGNCIDPPEECLPGYVKDKDGNCKKIPCENNPVDNPSVAGQQLSGINGGRFGCTRIGSGCGGDPSKKMHGGLDIKNALGEPIFAMYDGYSTSVQPYYEDAGWISYQTATVNGEQISIQYFHLQEHGRVSGPISAGDIIGYQGSSGNLASAIRAGKTESHVHIKIKGSSGTVLDPEDYIGSLEISEENSVNNNDCN